MIGRKSITVVGRREAESVDVDGQSVTIIKLESLRIAAADSVFVVQTNNL